MSRRRWMRSSWAILIAGILISLAMGSMWGRTVAAGQKHSFEASAQGVADALGTSVRRNVDLADTVGAMVKTMPGMTNAQFLAWYDALGADHFPGSPAFGFAQRVAAAELPAFVNLRATDVGLDGKPLGRIQVSPPGVRAEYCLAAIGVWKIAGTGVPPGLDFCMLPGTNFDAIAKSGVASATGSVVSATQQALMAQFLGTTTPIVPAGLNVFVFLAPLYRSDGAPPATEAARNADLMGWVGGEFDAKALLAGAIAHTPGLHVGLSHVNVPGGATLIASAGPRQAGKFSHTYAVDAEGRWLIKVQGHAPAGGPSATSQAEAVAAAGALASLLIFVLIQVLATSRARALVLVDEATLELRAAQRDRDRLLGRTVKSAEEERIRLAADLHDGPIQRLAALGYDLARCAGRLEIGENESGLALVTSVQADLEQEISGLRRLMSELRPPILDERGLAAAVRDYAASFGVRTGIATTVSVEMSDRIGAEAETVLYRVMQEAATNVAKHAQAENAWFTLCVSDGGIALLVTDDGVGFSTDDASEQNLLEHGHFGLVGMRARLEQVGGRLTVQSPDGAGTRLRAWLPRNVPRPYDDIDHKPDDLQLIASVT